MKAIKIMMVIAIAATASISAASSGAPACNARKNVGMLDNTSAGHTAAAKITVPTSAVKAVKGTN